MLEPVEEPTYELEIIKRPGRPPERMNGSAGRLRSTAERKWLEEGGAKAVLEMSVGHGILYGTVPTPEGKVTVDWNAPSDQHHPAYRKAKQHTNRLRAGLIATQTTEQIGMHHVITDEGIEVWLIRKA